MSYKPKSRKRASWLSNDLHVKHFTTYWKSQIHNSSPSCDRCWQHSNVSGSSILHLLRLTLLPQYYHISRNHAKLCYPIRTGHRKGLFHKLCLSGFPPPPNSPWDNRIERALNMWIDEDQTWDKLGRRSSLPCACMSYWSHSFGLWKSVNLAYKNR